MRFRFLSTTAALIATNSPRYLRMTTKNPSQSRVAVVGAGISGIMVGRELSNANLTIFEASKLGGLWEAGHNRMWDSLKTNLSKRTCVVSSLDWPIETPTFPSKGEVEQYIKTLSEPLDVTTNTIVNKVELVTADSSPVYRISYTDLDSGISSSDLFDNVVIASGFFSKSIYASINNEEFRGRLMGSHDYRNSDSFKGRKVIIVGGSFSGCEIAAEVAKEASEVHHIIANHAYILPTYLPENPSNPSSAVLPIDMVLYKLNDRRVQQLESILYVEKEHAGQIEVLFKSPEEDLQTHQYFEKVVGINNDILSFPGQLKPQKARVAISDNYRRMVKSGKIKIHHGKLKSLGNDHFTISNSKSNEDENVVPISIDDCIVATGFQPDTSIFCEQIKTQLQIHDSAENNDFLPFVLHKEVMHPNLPGLYFVGMYKGPYFGIIELQAKLVAGYINGSIPLPSKDRMEQSLMLMLQLRNNQPRGHFPHPDYVGMMFDYAKELGSVPSVEFLHQHRFISPHYFSGREDIMNALEEEVENSRRKGKLIPKYVYQALEYESWTFERIIRDRKSASIMRVRGKVSFTPIDDLGEYLLYKEEGKLTMANGVEFDASHYYIYHYNTQQDTLDIFFSTVGKPEVIDRPFISMTFVPTSEGWESKAYHLCGCDNYNAKYLFSFEGLSIPRFRVNFDVEGPEKDYIAETEFRIIHK